MPTKSVGKSFVQNGVEEIRFTSGTEEGNWEELVWKWVLASWLLDIQGPLSSLSYQYAGRKHQGVGRVYGKPLFPQDPKLGQTVQ